MGAYGTADSGSDELIWEILHIASISIDTKMTTIVVSGLERVEKMLLEGHFSERMGKCVVKHIIQLHRKAVGTISVDIRIDVTCFSTDDSRLQQRINW